MWKARVFTLYPDIYPGPLNKGLYGKALEKKNLELGGYQYSRFS